MKRFDCYEVIKAFYLFMNADSDISSEETEKFDEIVQTLEKDLNKSALTDFKEIVVNDFYEKLCHLTTSYDTFILSEIDVALGFCDCDDDPEKLSPPNNIGDKVITPRWLLWNLLAIAYSNGEYHDSEKAIIRHIAEKTEQPESILLEMEQYIKSIHSVETELAFVIKEDGLYSVIRPIVDELEYRKASILESALQLIADEIEKPVEKIVVTKNAYSRAVDTVKEKASPVTDAVKKKTAPITDTITEKTTGLYEQTKEKVDESGIAEELEAKKEKITGSIKSKAKEIELNEKVDSLLKKFKKN